MTTRLRRRPTRLIEETWQDIRFGARMLRKNAAFALVVVVILTLGIGANTAIFTLVNAVILKPLPVANPEELVLFSDTPSEGTSLGDPPSGKWRLFSYPAYRYFREHNDSFQDLCAFRSGEARLSVRLEGEQASAGTARAQGHLVSGNYFAVLGANAVLGRTLTDEDDAAAARPAVVASYGYWRDKLASDTSVIGRSIVLNETAFTLVGVMGPEFFGSRVRRSPDFWLPLAFQPQVELQESYLNNDKAYWLNMMGRLKPGTGIREARASIAVLLQQFLTNQAGAQISDERRQGIQSSYVDLADGSRGISGLRFHYSEPLNMLMAIVALILLIACANVGNLLLSRSFARQREILIRLALGANRARLIRQLLTESVLLSALGGGLGVLFAQWGATALVKLVAPTSPLDIRPDAMVLGFTALVSLLAGILFGLAPALRASRVDITSGLKDKSAGSGGGRLRFGLATTLVVSQVALSLTLLVGAGLFARSLLKLERQDLGFNRNNVLLVDIDPRLGGYKPAGLNSLYQQLLDRLATVPGVQSVSLASYSPMSGNSRTSNISIEGYTPADDEDMVISHLLVGPRYSETLGLPLLVGREIGPQDTPAARKVAVVNEAFAESFFPGQNPIGRRFGFGDDSKKSGDIEIVGVVRDAKYESAREKPVRMVYRPILQEQNASAYMSNLELRTAGDPLLIAAEVRAAIAQVDNKLPIISVTSLGKQLDQSLAQDRLMAHLVSFFGALALVLASVGLYGVMAHAVGRRTSEIGIRMALGAERSSILWMVLREAMMQVGVGVAIGIPLALAAGRLIASMLYGVEATDPLTISIATVVMLSTALVAGYIPAYQATKVDPMIALRYE